MRKRKKKSSFKGVLIIALVTIAIIGLFYYNNHKKLQIITVVSTIDEYDYYLESNKTQIYKDYYLELEKELEKEKIDEEKYVSIISKLFTIDFYTLNNKVTNKDIGGVQFLHSNLKEKFIKESSNSIYKYVKSNLYGNRKQKLPEVSNVEIEKITNLNYNNGNYQDTNGYLVELKIDYKKDYDYPKQVTLKLIHENEKLVIVEIK